MEIILYSTGCPRCNVLKKKLESKGVQYDECNDITLMRKLGIEQVPVLVIENNQMDYIEAVQWVNKQ